MVRHASFIAIVVAASGCFYADPINQRPSASIVQGSSATIYRGDTVELDATTYDPQGERVYLDWRAYACTDATTPAGCDTDPYYFDKLEHASIQVPSLRGDGVTPVQAIRVILEATDARGATAKPDQQLLLAVADHPPAVTIRSDNRHGYVVSTPIDVYALVTDPDDKPNTVTVAPWQIFTPPSQPTFTLLDKGLVAGQTPDTYWQVLTPNGTGDWTVRVIATDPVNATTMKDFTLTVVPDHAPCLAQWTPIAAVAPSSYPMQQPTLFEVLVVEDDLDPYPPVPTDPVLGQTSFAWSLLPPGASTRQPLSVTGNSVALDPASYSPGDILELRVEIQDRQHIPVACADTSPTCSVISDNSCIQRLTWRVEVQ